MKINTPAVSHSQQQMQVIRLETTKMFNYMFRLPGTILRDSRGNMLGVPESYVQFVKLLCEKTSCC